MRSMEVLRFALILSLVARAQLPLSFEIAAIHRNLSGAEGESVDRLEGGRVSVTNASLKTLILNAYDVLSFQIAGGPRWLDIERYDIEAKTGRPERPTREQFRVLLGNLLGDRFRLQTHWETREAPVLALLPEKAGPKMDVSSAPEPSVLPSRGRIAGTGVPIALLAKNLGNQLGQIVQDKTGLIGAYDFTLEWTPEQSADSPGPSIFASLREQLGLRLESQKGPVEVLVIDHVEKASEN